MITLVAFTCTVTTTTSLVAARNSSHPSCQAARLDSPGLNLFQLKCKPLVILHLETINAKICCFVMKSLLHFLCCDFCQVGLAMAQSVSISALSLTKLRCEKISQRSIEGNIVNYRFKQLSSCCLRSTRWTQWNVLTAIWICIRPR